MNREVLSVACVLLSAAACCSAAPNADVYDIRDYGAKPDGRTICTQAIQKAVDKCAADGGGTVHLPAGTWLTGTVYLQSRVTLYLETGCTLLGSADKADYGRSRMLADGGTFSYWAILAGRGLEHIAIRGRGVIDGQGANFKYKNGPRPKNIYLEDCRDVLVEGVRLRAAGSWMQHYRRCHRMTIRDIAVFNHVSYNNDGLNIDSCSDVVITGCVVDSDDDAIVLKSLSTQPCRNVAVSDCIVSSHCNSIKMGTESGGGFRDITISNCTVCSPRFSEVIYGRQRGLAAVALEIVDGGTLERVTVSNIAISGVSVPIFMRLGNRARTYENDQPKPAVGRFRNVIVRDIIATDCSEIGCSITGLAGHPVEGVTIADVSLGFDGGGTKEDAAREIPEKADSYPESTMFGRLPAYGFFCRHAKGLRLRNIRLGTSAADARGAIVLDDIEDCVVEALDAPFYANGAAMIRLGDSRDIHIRNCRPPRGTEVFVDVGGNATRDVVLAANDLAGAKTAVRRAAEVGESAVIMTANRMPAE